MRPPALINHCNANHANLDVERSVAVRQCLLSQLIANEIPSTIEQQFREAPGSSPPVKIHFASSQHNQRSGLLALSFFPLSLCHQLCFQRPCGWPVANEIETRRISMHVFHICFATNSTSFAFRTSPLCLPLTQQMYNIVYVTHFSFSPQTDSSIVYIYIYSI